MLDEIPKREYPYTHQTKVVRRESFFSFRNFGILCTLAIVGVTVFFIWTRVIDLVKESGGVPKFEDIKNQALSFISNPTVPAKSTENSKEKTQTSVTVIESQPGILNPGSIEKEGIAQSSPAANTAPLATSSQPHESVATTVLPAQVQNSNQTQTPVQPLASQGQNQSEIPVAALQAVPSSPVNPALHTTDNQKMDLQAAATQTPKVETAVQGVEVAQLQNSVTKTDAIAPVLPQVNPLKNEGSTETNAVAATQTQIAVETTQNTAIQQAGSQVDQTSGNTVEAYKNAPQLKNDSTKSREPFPRPKQPQTKTAVKSKNTTAKNVNKKTLPAAKAKSAAASKVMLQFQLGKSGQKSRPIPVAHKQTVSQNPNQDYADSWSKTYQAAGQQPGHAVAAQRTDSARPKIKGDHYAIQILAMHDEAKVKSFVNNRHLKGQARYFRTMRNDQPWYVLVYGDFDDFDNARVAMNRLPSDLQKYRPWVRRYASIREAMLKK